MHGFAQLHAPLMQIGASPLIEINAQHAVNKEREARMALQMQAGKRVRCWPALATA